MWPRVVEFMLGCWLAISPFVFRHGPSDTLYWVADFLAATLVIVLALISYWKPARRAHLLIIVVATGMILYGRFGGSHPLDAALQNHIVTGLLLLMFAIIPNEAFQPPLGWYEGSSR